MGGPALADGEGDGEGEGELKVAELASLTPAKACVFTAV
jgi:hypothetical protein